MSATKYQIFQWVAVMGPNNRIQPAVYIKPDNEFLRFAMANQYELFCNISGTNTRYDGMGVNGYVNSSSKMPNCRPNFAEVTGFYIITLDANWVEYPMADTLGFIEFHGMNSHI